MIQQIPDFKNPLFRPISTQSLACLNEREILMNSKLTMGRNGQNPVLVILTKKYFYVQNNGLRFETEANYFLKFQAIFENESDIKSRKIGFKLFQEQNQSQASFYTNDTSVLMKWFEVLKGNFSQYGFHQQFKAIRRVGKGQFATVFEVESLQTGSHYAVKAFSKASLNKTPKAMQSIINEINIMRSFCHRNLQKLESVYQSQNSIYVITQLLRGGTLYERIQGLFKENPQSKMEHIRQFMYGFLDGLSKLKQLNIVHRDLKLQNIMFRSTRDFQPVIIDFGLGTFCHESQYLYYRCGTPGYVSPEVMACSKDKKLEPDSDLFSAGAVFHYLLVEKPLFQGRSSDQVLYKNKNFEFDLTDYKYRNVDQDGMSLLTKMLQKDPKRRISVNEALMDDFFSHDMKNDSPASTVVFGQDQSMQDFDK